VIDHLFENYSTKTTMVTTDIENRVFHIKTVNLSEEIPFSLPDFDLALVTAGGWLEYADSKY
jgi:3-isopropylmalate/(R)-2-methylmalate dehydratase small subunit